MMEDQHEYFILENDLEELIECIGDVGISPWQKQAIRELIMNYLTEVKIVASIDLEGNAN